MKNGYNFILRQWRAGLYTAAQIDLFARVGWITQEQALFIKSQPQNEMENNETP